MRPRLVYLIYRPKGKSGRKDEIKANWVSDANMNSEKAKGAQNHPVLGRFHGFSATGTTVAEFAKIAQSLHPIRDEKGASSAAAQTSALKIHPKVFNMINCWISDSESPVVTEINLDAVEKNGNEFNQDGLKQDGDDTRASRVILRGEINSGSAKFATRCRVLVSAKGENKLAQSRPSLRKWPRRYP